MCCRFEDRFLKDFSVLTEVPKYPSVNKIFLLDLSSQVRANKLVFIFIKFIWLVKQIFFNFKLNYTLIGVFFLSQKIQNGDFLYTYLNVAGNMRVWKVLHFWLNNQFSEMDILSYSIQSRILENMNSKSEFLNKIWKKNKSKNTFFFVFKYLNYYYRPNNFC